MERRRKYLDDIKLIVHSIRDNMRKQQEESQEHLAEQGRRYIKEVRLQLGA